MNVCTFRHDTCRELSVCKRGGRTGCESPVGAIPKPSEDLLNVMPQTKLLVIEPRRYFPDMVPYIGFKSVMARPMTRADYDQLRNQPSSGEDADGYLVMYEDSRPNHSDFEGYISWSPAEPFEKAYSKITLMSFAQAMHFASRGIPVASVNNPMLYSRKYEKTSGFVVAGHGEMPHYGANELRLYSAYGDLVQASALREHPLAFTTFDVTHNGWYVLTPEEYEELFTADGKELFNGIYSVSVGYSNAQGKATHW